MRACVYVFSHVCCRCTLGKCHTSLLCYAKLQALEAGAEVVTSMCNQMEQWGAVVDAAKSKRMHQLILPPPQVGLHPFVHSFNHGF